MSDLLLIALQVAVPLRIAEMRGGPTEEDLARAKAFGLELASRGDVLLYGGKKGEAADLFNRLADALAVTAYLPGGSRFAEMRWAAAARAEARRDGGG